MDDRDATTHGGRGAREASWPAASSLRADGPRPPDLASLQYRGAIRRRRQLAYEIEALRRDGSDAQLATSGEVDGDAQVAVAAPGGPLASREVRDYRVRVRSSAGWSAWSDAVRVEAGLLDAADWVGEAITLPGRPGRDGRRRRRSCVGRSTSGAGPAARLYVTSLGLHRVTHQWASA